MIDPELQALSTEFGRIYEEFSTRLRALVARAEPALRRLQEAIRQAKSDEERVRISRELIGVSDLVEVMLLMSSLPSREPDGGTDRVVEHK